MRIWRSGRSKKTDQKSTVAKILESVKLFDVYRGKQVEEGKRERRHCALTYRDKDKTLTDDEVAAVHNDVLNALKDKLNAVLREI